MMPTDGPVPNLRFPEFRDAGPWEVKRLGDIANVVRGGSPRPISAYLTEDPTGLNWLQIGDLSDGGKYVLSTGQKIKQSGLPSTREVAPGNLILSNSMSFGRPYIAQIPVCVHDGWLVIDNDKNASLSEFLYYLLLSESSQKYMRDAAAGGGVRNLNADLVKLLPAPLPSLPEQQKIADCLSSLDDLIRAEGARLGALKDHKRALMQRLFPRPGETTPRLRFPEFRDAGLWEVKRLSEVCEINPPSGELPESFIYIDLESVSAGELLQKKVISRNEAPSRAQRLLSPGDIIYQMVRPYQRNNLLFAIVGDMKYVASTGYAQLRAKSSAEFLFQLVHTDSFVGSVLQKCTGSNYPAINPSDLGEIHVSVPSNPEQHRIADCLASLDELIRAQGERLAALKAHKRGLMQQLFPQGLA